MRYIKGLVLVFAVAACLVSMLPGAEAAANELITVKVNIVIDNPDYFWHYPFGGIGADELAVTGMGKRDVIENGSAGKLVTFQVPKSYQFRMSLDVCGKNSVLKSMSFSKNNINKDKQSFTITLKAPEPELIKVEAKEFDDIK